MPIASSAQAAPVGATAVTAAAARLEAAATAPVRGDWARYRSLATEVEDAVAAVWMEAGQGGAG